MIFYKTTYVIKFKLMIYFIIDEIFINKWNELNQYVSSMKKLTFQKNRLSLIQKNEGIDMLIILICISLTTEEKIAEVTITLKSFVKKIDASLSLLKSGETTKHLSIKTKISDISIND